MINRLEHMLKKWNAPIPRMMEDSNGDEYQFYKEANGHGWVKIINHQEAEIHTETGVRMYIFFKGLRLKQSE